MPADFHHGFAVLRGAVCEEVKRARTAGDAQSESRAWKLLTFFDRLLLCPTPSTRGGKGHNGMARTLSARLRLANKGDWGALWREAALAAQRAPQKAGREDTSEEEARSIRALLADGLVSKALSRVTRKSAVMMGQGVLAALQELFPSGVAPGTRGQAQVDPEVRTELVAEARKALVRYKARSAPGQNGSRFEHWATVQADSVAWDAASEVVVMFLLGECPAGALAANLGARLMALRKPNGKVRPVACGSVLRRLAARSACAVFRDDIRTACGEHQ